MSRSIKKGPFAAPELLKRVDELNKTGEKKVLKTWSLSLIHICGCVAFLRFGDKHTFFLTGQNIHLSSQRNVLFISSATEYRSSSVVIFVIFSLKYPE